jgi:hypothetical protein
MTIYWLLLLFPAIMALAYPLDSQRYVSRAFQRNMMALFVSIYTLVGGLRYQTGGDWVPYLEIYNDIAAGSFIAALTRIDPLYGAVNWVSAQIGGEIFLTNGICCAILGYGTVATAKRFREPWMAIVIAVPYLLIVVGLGYVRQGAAIGFILLALANLDRARPLRAIILLALATGFHSTSVFMHPLFAFAIAQHNRLYAILGTVAAGLLYVYVFAPRLDIFSSTYLDAGYNSAGAGIRIAMGVIPAIVVLLFRNRMIAEQQARTTWLLIALVNLAALAALVLSPSSTAVDRIALYFSIIQLAAYGQFCDLISVRPRNVIIVRLGLIVLAALVQMVWLIFADHSEFWVPYKSILQPMIS